MNRNLIALFIPVRDQHNWSPALLDELEEVYFGRGSDSWVIGWVPRMLGM